MSTPSFASSSRFDLRWANCSSSEAIGANSPPQRTQRTRRNCFQKKDLCVLRVLCGGELSQFHLLSYTVKHPVDELHGVLGAERARQLEGLVDDDGVRGVLVADEFADGHADDQPIDHRHPFGAPVFGGVRDERVHFVQSFDRIPRERGGKLAQGVLRRFGVRPLEIEERLDGAVDAGLSDLPLIQDLQDRFSGAVTAILLHDLIWAITVAISTAATAASQPLLAGPSPARAARDPASSRSVTKSLYFETTTATRNPAAAGVASIVRMETSAEGKRIHQPADDDADREEAGEHHAAEPRLLARVVFGQHR